MAGKLAARVRGLSEAAVRAQFGTEEQCRAVLVKLRWPGGFVCPACGHDGCTLLTKRRLHQCTRCRHQASLLAGTIFHATIDRRAVDPFPKGREPEPREGCC
jgi:hypothetical protein